MHVSLANENDTAASGGRELEMEFEHYRWEADLVVSRTLQRDGYLTGTSC